MGSSAAYEKHEKQTRSSRRMRTNDEKPSGDRGTDNPHVEAKDTDEAEGADERTSSLCNDHGITATVSRVISYQRYRLWKNRHHMLGELLALPSW
ncbi:Uu.00g059510.m01.CDS01 [Anthostomella pinea]|uniref:Uu.00g059510.m01.CDS01 n=1 Tax=Anthostomella pinea TaxID=933095 RepID=A0AAI8YJY9_9PEZI|nr:Uu.00g059510.m01.CDS01 [Anthostomella pinea]